MNVSIRILTALGAVMACTLPNAHAETSVSGSSFSTITVDASDLADANLETRLERAVESSLRAKGKIDAGASRTLVVKVLSSSVRPDGTPATLRQGGGRDVLRVALSEEVGSESRPLTEVKASVIGEGYENRDRSAREALLIRKLADSVANRAG